MSKIVAPWTPAQVKELEKWQAATHVHPYTCGDRGDGNHTHNGRDLGCLTPTVDGWICESCDYTQRWAHDLKMPRNFLKDLINQSEQDINE